LPFKKFKKKNYSSDYFVPLLFGFSLSFPSLRSMTTLEIQWKKFWIAYSTSVIRIVGNDKVNWHAVKPKVLAYNTLRLGKDGYTNSLIAKSIDFHIFITDLEYEAGPISAKTAVALQRSWKKLALTMIHSYPATLPSKSLKQRYSYFGEPTIQHSLCLTADTIYEWVVNSDLEDQTLEAFAGGPNHTLENWCSLFEDLEIPMGSLGSIFRLPNLYDFELIISNPPYQNPIMEEMAMILSTFDGSSISILPDWRSRSTDFSQDLVIGSVKPKDIRRHDTPYPTFEILRKSPRYRGTIFFNRMSFANEFGNNRRSPDVAIICVILGSVDIWQSLVSYLN